MFTPSTAIRDALGPLGLVAIRGLERAVSPARLYSLLAPAAFARAALMKSEPMPGFFGRSISTRMLRRARQSYLLSRVPEFFQDRLTTSKWKSRFETKGLAYLEEARASGRRIVLVCCHFGAFKLIPFWLRALGFPTIALLKGNSAGRSRAKRLKDRFSPFSELPTVLYSNDQLREMFALLSAGNLLLLAVDRDTGRQITLPLDQDWSFRMATGAIRLAAHCRAELVPCWMTDEGHWNFRLEIGSPVPREYLGNPPDLMGAGRYLVRQMLPLMRSYPERCTNYLLGCFQQMRRR